MYCRNCPYLFQFVCVLLCRFCLHGNRLALCGHNDLFTCSKDNTPRINTFSIQKTGSPCDVLQELPIFVSICLGFTLRILPARQSACPLHPEFPAAYPRSHIPWSQRLFSPAPKITLFPYRKQAAPAMCCKNCPYLFQFVCVLLCGFCLHGNRLALCGHNDLFTCSKDNTPRINTFSIQKTGSPCDVLQELPIFVSICLGFTLRILSARQSACPLHPEFPAACPRSHIPWSQQPFSPAPKITLFPYRKRAAPANACRNCPYLFQFVCVLLCRFCLHGNRLALCV